MMTRKAMLTTTAADPVAAAVRIIAEAKAELRRAMRARLAGLSDAARAEASAEICVWLLEEAAVNCAPGLVLFAAHGAEPDLRALAVAALQRGIPIAYPRSADGVYEPVRVTDLAADLVPGRYGILEPRAALPVLNMAERAGWTWLVPGVAFTEGGARLGHGGGYYDRLLAGVRGARIGVAQACQIVDALPSAAHDIALTALVTPAGYRRCTMLPPATPPGDPPDEPPPPDASASAAPRPGPAAGLT